MPITLPRSKGITQSLIRADTDTFKHPSTPQKLLTTDNPRIVNKLSTSASALSPPRIHTFLTINRRPSQKPSRANIHLEKTRFLAHSHAGRLMAVPEPNPLPKPAPNEQPRPKTELGGSHQGLIDESPSWLVGDLAHIPGGFAVRDFYHAFIAFLFLEQRARHR